MKSSLKPAGPGRVIAEFGQVSADFVIREDEIGEDDPDDAARFMIEDADEIGGTLAVAELRHIDLMTGEADLDLKVGAQTNELAYQLTVSNMRDAIRAMLDEYGVETAHFANTNLPPDMLERIIGSSAANNVVEFTLPHEQATDSYAMAA